MDALVDEFPDMAEARAAEGDDDDDSEDEERRLEAERAKKKELPKVDHTTTEYAPFRRNLYVEVPELKAMSDADVEALKKSLDGIKTRGKRVPRPIKRWAQAGLSDRLLAVIEKQGYAALRRHLHHHLHHHLHLPCRYAAPFPIQAQALPCIMSGRDVIAVARTGSGKTMG